MYRPGVCASYVQTLEGARVAFITCTAPAVSSQRSTSAGHRRYSRRSHDADRQHLRRTCLQRQVEAGGASCMYGNRVSCACEVPGYQPPSHPVRCRAMFVSPPVSLVWSRCGPRMNPLLPSSPIPTQPAVISATFLYVSLLGN